MLKISVIDGQGGGIGTTIIKSIKEAFGERTEVWALGTNAIATAQMMKARANPGATGENAICHCVNEVHMEAAGSLNAECVLAISLFPLGGHEKTKRRQCYGSGTFEAV